MQSFSSDLQLAIEAARAAGKVVKAGYGNIKKTEVKENGAKGIVTNVDKESEEVILKILQAKSNYAIFSEETGNIKGTDGLWVIDPIDGTTNFSRGIPLFCISIALMKENKIELGVIYNPVLDELYYAEKNNGAYLNEKKIGVSQQKTLKGSVVIINCGYALENKQIYLKVLENIYKECPWRTLGTTAYELCMIANGVTDGFISNGDELYDYAAGLIIIEEAGGKISDWKGNEWSKDNSFILASNRKIHTELTECLQGLQ